MENKIIKIKTSDDDTVRFKPEGIFISNNENYIAVVGKSETWVIDTISGKIEYKQPMPIIKEEEFRAKKFKNKVLGTNNADDSISEVNS